MKFPLFALFAGFIAVIATPASALPAAGAAPIGIEASDSSSPMVEKVAQRRSHVTGPGTSWDNSRRHNRRFNKGHDRRYDNYRGWNRYNSRPRGWRNRGCVAVGPIWFCK